jgi:hypothetical protein
MPYESNNSIIAAMTQEYELHDAHCPASTGRHTA